MAFQTLRRGCNGMNGNTRWGVSCWTTQDFEADPTGNVIYAEGTVTFSGPGGVSEQYLHNRGYSTENGKRILRPPFYSLADANHCLNQIFTKLVMIGRQGS